ncbi:8-amino-7-oxononanoate synthase [Planctomycetes bacterium Poly30]|uniref:8-amino-7-oxononanoate synthase n=1 Tax=Saltatorellus ferox TaxID=2528018 RepID=A0A518ESI3_9BACT|nr:8-amino-7-oxononanoate synthase [Planctomycetes bacterium Poly30]
MKRPRPAFESTTATTVRRDGIDLLAFHGCGYLGLAHDPRVRQAAKDAIDRYGPSGLASRGTSGNLEIHETLEVRLAEFLDVEAALVVADGYLADLALVSALESAVGVALHDSDAHPSLTDAARMAGLEAFHYGPGDMTHATALLDRFKDRSPLVLTDGIFAMHGRLAPLNELVRYLPTGGILVVDDCHGVGVLGPNGRGTCEAFGISDERILITGSLAKAIGSGGGFIAGSAEHVASVKRFAASFIGTTALSPPLAAAALASLEIIESEPQRLERLRANTGQLHRSARRIGAAAPSGTFFPVLVLKFETSQEAERLSAALHVAGLFAPAIHYPTAGAGGTIRIAVNSEHTAADLRRLEETLEEHLTE